MAAPLPQLFRKDTPFVWNDEQEDSFQEIKVAMANEPVRRIFDPQLKCDLHTDASTVGIGAILMQDKHPIGYFSRRRKIAKLNMQKAAEKNKLHYEKRHRNVVYMKTSFGFITQPDTSVSLKNFYITFTARLKRDQRRSAR
jgi:hypothetical protein